MLHISTSYIYLFRITWKLKCEVPVPLLALVPLHLGHLLLAERHGPGLLLRLMEGGGHLLHPHLARPYPLHAEDGHGIGVGQLFNPVPRTASWRSSYTSSAS